MRILINVRFSLFGCTCEALVRRFKCLRAPLFAALFVGSGVREKARKRQRGPENVVAGNMEELHFSFEVCFSGLSPDLLTLFAAMGRDLGFVR